MTENRVRVLHSPMAESETAFLPERISGLIAGWFQEKTKKGENR
jgi:hypothetical protein